MTDQPQPGGPGIPGAWQPVPGGGDYDPDQTMHVSFAAQLPPEPGPGEDPLGAHGPVGPAGPAGGPVNSEGDPVTQWSIPVMRDEGETDSGEFSAGTFSSSAWDQAPSPGVPMQSLPARMFGQGAAAAQAARAAGPAGGRPANPEGSAHLWPAGPGAGPHAAGQARTADHRDDHADDRRTVHRDDYRDDQRDDNRAATRRTADDPGAGPQGAGLGPGTADPGTATGQWPMPPVTSMTFTGPDGGDAVPWLPAHAPAADATWSGVVDDPEGPDTAAGHPDSPPPDDPPPDDPPAARPDAGQYPESATDGTLLAPGDPATAYGTPAHTAPAGHPDAPEAGPYADTADVLLVPQEPRPGTGTTPGTATGNESAPVSATGLGSATGPGPGPDAGAHPHLQSQPEPQPQPVRATRSEHPLASYMLRVNGADRPVTDAWLGESLLYVLRERLGLAGAKDGCEQGECGACSVQVDGRLVASCLVPAATAAGSEVRTVEGLTTEGRPSDVQQALADCGAVQCGFCIPGLAMTVHDLLEGNHRPTDLEVRQAVSGNLCRCSGYRGVLDAVRQVVEGRGSNEEGLDEGDFTRVPHQGRPNPSEAPA